MRDEGGIGDLINKYLKKLVKHFIPFAEKVLKALRKKFKLRIIYLKRFARVQKFTTTFLKPLDRVNHYAVEINIAYKCNLKCFNCEASCRQAPSQETMSLEQINKFIDESIEQGRKWKNFKIVGGEPTLHNQIFDILQRFLIYKKNFSPNTEIIIVTNGFGEKVNSILSKITKEVTVWNSKKTSNVNQFTAFNNAPKDTLLYKYADYSNGCFALRICGIGFTPYGFYPCAVAGNIDKVFGFNIGRKKLPKPEDSMMDQVKTLCQYCGHFMYFGRGGGSHITTTKEIISQSWKKAYENYKIKKPSLTLY